MNTSKQILLVVLDGFGYRKDKTNNAIAEAKMPFWQKIYNNNHGLLDASGLAVGLSEGQMGNSEVGHMTMGCGQILDSDIVRISKTIENGEFFKLPHLVELCQFVKQHNSTLHLFGLLSPGGVHSHSSHLHALLKFCKLWKLDKVAIHVITDGRDTAPSSAAAFVQELENIIEEEGVGRIATVVGRYYAMDRDNNWDRTSKATEAMFECKGEVCHLVRPSEKLLQKYEAGQTDEFVEPMVFSANERLLKFSDFDSAFFFNFRADRARQLAEKIRLKTKEMNGKFLTMSKYDDNNETVCLFPPEKPHTCLSECLSKAGLTQTHIAETEKYAHATYFFNGGREGAISGEKFILIDSRKDIATHDQAPEMKAREITDAGIAELEHGTNFIMINYANADMVGHSGNKAATILALQFLDQQLERLCNHALKVGALVLITADHGNAEVSQDESTKEKHTAHTNNPVPVVLVGKESKLSNGGLVDIAPTILSLLGLPNPSTMTGKSLV